MCSRADSGGTRGPGGGGARVRAASVSRDWQVAAFTYEAGLATYQAAIGTEDEAAARDVFEVAQVAVLAALERAMALDNEPDEKGGP